MGTAPEYLGSGIDIRLPKFWQGGIDVFSYMADVKIGGVGGKGKSR